MRFTLKSLLVIVTLLAIGGAVFISTQRRPHQSYWGHLSDKSPAQEAIRRIDPSVTFHGGGGGGGGPGKIFWRSYVLTGQTPMGAEFLESIRSQILSDFKDQGIKPIESRPLEGADVAHLGAKAKSWGFQIMVWDRGFKAAIAVRLLSLPDGTGSHKGPMAELHENIVVFPRD